MPITEEHCRSLLALADVLLALAAVVSLLPMRRSSAVSPRWLRVSLQGITGVATTTAIVAVLLIAWCAQIIR
jgi:hypothetical protein